MGDEEDDSAAAAAAEMPWPPEKWEVGLLCDAKDEFGTWYKGKVVDVDPAKHPDEVKVHYNGTGPSALGNGRICSKFHCAQAGDRNTTSGSVLHPRTSRWSHAAASTLARSRKQRCVLRDPTPSDLRGCRLFDTRVRRSLQNKFLGGSSPVVKEEGAGTKRKAEAGAEEPSPKKAA